MRTSDDVTILTISYFLNSKYRARCFRQSDETRSYKCSGINTGNLKLRRFALSPKFQTFRLEIEMMKHFVRSDQNICGQCWQWSSLIGLLILVSQIEMSLSTWQNCCSQYHYFTFCLQEQTKLALALVGCVQLECTAPLGKWNFLVPILWALPVHRHGD